MCVPFLVELSETSGTLRVQPNPPAVVAPPETPAREIPFKDPEPAPVPEDRVGETPEPETEPEDPVGKMPEPETEPENPVGETPEPETEPENPVGKMPEPETEPENPVGETPEPETEPENPVSETPEPETEPEDPVGEMPEPVPTGRVLPITDSMAVAGGRVTTLDTTLENIASIEITGKPEAGNLTVNPDNTLALVLTGTDHSGPLSFQYTATFEDGTTQTFDQTVDVKPLTHLEGWSTGENVYMLETDAQGRLVVEHGDDHRTVHVSNSGTALSRAEIAAMHDNLEASDITADWLLENPEYGATPDLALDEELGSQLWSKITEDPGSHWLLLERGHDYDFNIVPGDAGGESELHPLYIGAYGQGTPPKLANKVSQSNIESNMVIEGVEFADGLRLINGDNLLLSELITDGRGIVLQGTGDQTLEGITLRNSTIHDAIQDAASGGRWGDSDKIQGIFASDIDGLLIEGVHIDQTGWEEDYSLDGDPAFGQWPSKMSQNVYIQFDNNDVTFRDNISMRAAAFGVQVRPGGYIEDNVFIDNNAALNALGGETLNDGVKSGHFSFLADNLATSGGAKQTDQIAALTWALISTEGSTRLDNIVAHLADPKNPSEFDEKVGNGGASKDYDGYFDNTVVYNWVAKNFSGNALERNADKNVEDVDPVLADQTTIQNFTADLLGQPTATIDDLGQYLRAQFTDDQPNDVTADDIIAYFQETFGIAPDERTSAETLRFVPNDLGDGVRWDNRINWTTEDLPGTVDGDSVDLGGNWVTFATITGTVEDLEFGSGGRLNVTSGRLNIDGETSVGADGGEIDISKAGQIWLTDYSDEDGLDIDIEGGRFANTGFFDGLLDMHVTGGQALVGVDDAVMELNQDSVLTIEGDEAKVGFDGDEGGVSVLRMETGSQLRMVADENGFSTIEEFRSGAHDNDEPDVLSAFDMGEGTLLIDISAIAGGQAREEVIVDTDEVFGMFDDVEFVGLGDNQDATLTVDYENDRVTVSLSEANSGGTGQVNIIATGAMVTGMEDDEIWNALIEGKDTYLEDNADIPDPSVSKTPDDEELEAELA